MAQPQGYVDPQSPNAICKLHKAIYGLKQAPRAWYNELMNFLVSQGFIRAASDSSLFINYHSTKAIYLIVYVDDIIITGPDSSHLLTFIQVLATRFALKDLGSLSYFLGVEVIPTTTGLFLSQRKYVCDLLQQLGMLDTKAATTPLSVGTQLTATSGTTLPEPKDYRAALGSLQYLTLTRPDVAFAVNRLSQFMQSLTLDHWHALKRLLRYVNGTKDQGLLLHRDSPPTLHGFVDADWAGNKDDYTSTMGHVIFLGRNPLTWCSKKQKGVARSSNEAEYRAIAHTTAELLWIRNLFIELRIPVTPQPVLYCDNLGATLSANPVFDSKMKHLALAFHFICEHVQNGTLKVVHVPTGDQLADFLTKPLTQPRLDTLLLKIGLSNRPSILRGHDKNSLLSTSIS